MNVHAALDDQLSQDLEKALRIPQIRPVENREKPAPTKITPARVRQQMGSIHALVEQRRIDTRKGLNATLEDLASQKKAEKERHKAAMATIAEREATAREQAKADMERDQLLIATSKAALSVLDGK